MMSDLRFAGSVWCNIDIALHHLETIYKQEIEALALSVIEWYLLQMLYEQDGQIVSRLADKVGRPASSVTSILNNIQDKGLIERRPHPADRRAVRIHLTPKGQALKSDVAASVERIESKIHKRLSSKELQGYESVIADLQTMALYE